MRPIGVTAFASECGISRNAIYKAIDRGDVVQRPDKKIDLDNSTNRTYMEHCHEKNPSEKKGSGKVPAKKKTKKTAQKGKRKAARQNKKDAISDSKPVAEKRQSNVNSATEIEPDENQGLLSFDDEDLDMDSISPELQQILKHGIGDSKKVNLDSLKILEEIKSKIQKRKEDRKLLIKRDLVKRVFGRLYAIDNTELKTMGIRLAPDIASLVQTEVETVRTDNPEYRDNPILLKVNEFINSTEFMRKINELTTNEVMKTLNHAKRVMDEFLIEMGSEVIDQDELETEEQEPAEVFNG